MTLTLSLALALTAVDAPVTQVTVFTDQARIVRMAQVQVAGTQSIELPPLRDNVDQSSIRVEAQGAEVRRVDIERLTPEKLKTAEAKALLAEIEKLDVDLSRLSNERQALAQQQTALSRVTPTLPQADPLKPTPRLNASGWAQGAQFSAEQLAKVQQRLRDGDQQIKKLNEKRAELVEKAQKLGNPERTSGWKVVAQLAGNGPATVQLVYLVRNARWTPTWDLQLQPDANTVALSLAGLVSQDTGEDWTQASLVLSTAIPSFAVQPPKLTTWKIGVSDRFIPTPTPMYEQVIPPPPAPPVVTVRTEEDLVRYQLAQLGVLPSGAAQAGPVSRTSSIDFADEEISGELVKPADRTVDYRNRELERRTKKKAERAPPPPPPPSPAPMAAAPAPARAYESVAEAREEESDSFFGSRKEYVPTTAFSLSPPPAWRPPSYGSDSPVTLASGYDLAFTSLQKETIPTAKGARRVALWSSQWPVTVERKLFPALTKDAFLVAELKNPSSQVLPGGPAQLYVGADPAGTARLKLVSPGEAFTLPLGIDRALKPVRNVQLVETTQGIISKDEVGTYTVTIEVANPYKAPVAVRVYDQWPVTDQKDLEVKLVETKPLAIQDAKKGALEWRLTIPPQQKTSLSFVYTLKRPRGWKLQQQEVTP